MELVELQCSSDLKAKFCESKLVTFYEKYIPHDLFPQLVKQAKKMITLFGSTYLYEQLFSQMKYAKCKARARLTREHQEGTFRLATTSMKPDLDQLSKGKQQHFLHLLQFLSLQNVAFNIVDSRL